MWESRTKKRYRREKTGIFFQSFNEHLDQCWCWVYSDEDQACLRSRPSWDFFAKVRVMIKDVSHLKDNLPWCSSRGVAGPSTCRVLAVLQRKDMSKIEVCQVKRFYMIVLHQPEV